jgi:pyruvate,water dikinase
VALGPRGGNGWSAIHDTRGHASAAAYGSKAANLMLLARHDVPVPPGVCFSSAADAADADDTIEIVQSVRNVVAPWAVRSSSLSEDSAELAFPGLYRTVLGVASASSLRPALASVAAGPDEKAWEAYAHRPHVTQRIPALVQTIVPPRAAGVIFTRHPISLTDSLLINSTFGLGKSVVDGTIDPDEFEVSPHGDVRSAAIASKTRAMDELGNLSEVSDELASTPSLDDAGLRALTETARAVEAVMGSPQDIEWVQDRQRVFWILQSRPITALGR